VPTQPDLNSLGFLVHDIARLLRRNFDRRVQSLGLTQAQWRAIVHLSRNQGMNHTALAESLEIQPITLTRLIDRMEAAGWVERRRHPSDRRAMQLYLTARARPILKKMRALVPGTIGDALAGLPASARERLTAHLQTIKRNLLAAEAATAAAGAGRENKHGRRDRRTRGRRR
jgi:DNA-binding MarR family transcriptional regulator